MIFPPCTHGNEFIPPQSQLLGPTIFLSVYLAFWPSTHMRAFEVLWLLKGRDQLIKSKTLHQHCVVGWRNDNKHCFIEYEVLINCLQATNAMQCVLCSAAITQAKNTIINQGLQRTPKIAHRHSYDANGQRRCRHPPHAGQHRWAFWLVGVFMDYPVSICVMQDW